MLVAFEISSMVRLLPRAIHSPSGAVPGWFGGDCPYGRLANVCCLLSKHRKTGAFEPFEKGCCSPLPGIEWRALSAGLSHCCSHLPETWAKWCVNEVMYLVSQTLTEVLALNVLRALVPELGPPRLGASFLPRQCRYAVCGCSLHDLDAH